MTRLVPPSPRLGPAFSLAIALAVGRARAADAPPTAEVARAGEAVVEAAERASRLRRSGRADLAAIADEVVEARRAVHREVEAAVSAEGAAARAEEAQGAALRELDRAAAAREERRQRLARLADQLAQAETELREPPVVAMPKGRRGPPPKGIALDVESGADSRAARDAKAGAASKKGGAK